MLVLALALFGCKRAGSPKLEGHWRGVRADGVPDSVQNQATGFATGMDIVAIGNQIAIKTPAGQNPVATYVVDKEDATSLVIHTDKDGTTETFNFSEKGDVMTWRVDAQRSITFKKIP
jgi:hypothetical protein